VSNVILQITRWLNDSIATLSGQRGKARQARNWCAIVPRQVSSERTANANLRFDKVLIIL